MRRARPVPRRVFVDTSFYGAIAFAGDAHHRNAVQIGRDLATSRVSLVTTNVVVIETHSLLLARAGREVAFLALQRIYAARESLVRIDEADEQRAMAILAQYDDKAFSLADATSFAVMERLGIDTAVAFDRHFVQFGWQVMGAE